MGGRHFFLRGPGREDPARHFIVRDDRVMNLSDKDWDELAQDSGAAESGAELRALMDGVIAAPNARTGDVWTQLCDPVPDAAVLGRLNNALAQHRAAVDPGFTQGPAPVSRLAALREELKRRGLAGFIIPRNDEYMGEYVPARADRLPWLTGFDGSAGTVVVGLEKAAIFVDGRYTIQVRDQVDTEAFEPRHLIEEPAAGWIAETFEAGAKIGFDPWLHTQAGAARLKQAAKRAGAELVRVEGNPIDAVWSQQPAAPISPAVPHDLAFAGESSADKRRKLADSLAEDGADAVVLTATDSIAWLLNIRGSDVPNCPLSLSFAILNADGSADWFVDGRKVTTSTRNSLGNAVAVHPIESFSDALTKLGAAGKTVSADPASAPCHVFDTLKASGATMRQAEDPCALPKAIKNSVELAGTRSAHRRDAAALIRFFKWIEETAPGGGVTELQAIAKLRTLRGPGEHYRDDSFDTIAGSGPNGAIVHYRASETTDRELQQGELLLVDSGGQYLDGTTDVTRTVAIGEPSAEMRERYTLVLKGHVAVARARFPKGVTGSQIDPMARAPLWARGLDFDHGTGHGVGSYLNVHEGPQRIAKSHSAVALEPGMILSNEPGYYKTGAYGIRIENLVVVSEVQTPPAGAERELLEFETITLAPYDRNLIDTAMLDADEMSWINAYHARVLAEISPFLDPETRDWLVKKTASL